MKRIVIIGGMGPQASVELHRRLIQRAVQAGARENHEFPEVLHFSLPVVDFIDDERAKDAALKRIVRSVRQARPWRRGYLYPGLQHSTYITA
jgi:aspartate/glutamate racemase